MKKVLRQRTCYFYQGFYTLYDCSKLDISSELFVPVPKSISDLNQKLN